VKGTFFTAQAVLPQMFARRHGAILTMSSDFAVIGMPAAPAYAAAKTAVYSLTKALALECAPFDVRVNALGPGPIDTPLLKGGRSGKVWDDASQILLNGVPMRRFGEPEEVAAVADYLLSDQASYITGQLVQPNGGQVMW
jgi:3-oxoacyl-[acyl-carrier protein] reductase